MKGQVRSLVRMRSRRIDVASIRRKQIVEAAVGIISAQGLQNLSLSEIEKKAGMSRGQLTYYFKAKEDILLAVFDRLMEVMHERAQADGCQGWSGAGDGWERVRILLGHILLSRPFPEFGALQYTFLSQISHREDFRQRLADLYEQWRRQMTQDFAQEAARRPPPRQVSPRALATFVQAVLHGLFIQQAADPDAFDRQEQLDLLLDILETYLWPSPPRKARAPQPRSPRRRSPANGTAAHAGPAKPDKVEP
jgi:AcrR family transcriptional regulator